MNEEQNHPTDLQAPEVVEDPGDVLNHVPLEVEEANLGIAKGVHPADDVETQVHVLQCALDSGEGAGVQGVNLIPVQIQNLQLL